MAGQRRNQNYSNHQRRHEGDGGVYILTGDRLGQMGLCANVPYSVERGRDAASLRPVNHCGIRRRSLYGRPAETGFGWFLESVKGHLAWLHYGET